MRDDERKRLIDLAEKARGTDLYEEIHDRIYASGRLRLLRIELEVNDPMMELSSVKGEGDMVATEIMAELSDEWFSRYQGASWWIDRYHGENTSYQRGRWHATEEPFPQPDPHKSMDPHEGHEIHVLVVDKTWHIKMPDGTLGDAKELVSCDEERLYCQTCGQDIE